MSARNLTALAVVGFFVVMPLAGTGQQVPSVPNPLVPPMTPVNAPGLANAPQVWTAPVNLIQGVGSTPGSMGPAGMRIGDVWVGVPPVYAPVFGDRFPVAPQVLVRVNDAPLPSVGSIPSPIAPGQHGYVADQMARYVQSTFDLLVTFQTMSPPVQIGDMAELHVFAPVGYSLQPGQTPDAYSHPAVWDTIEKVFTRGRAVGEGAVFFQGVPAILGADYEVCFKGRFYALNLIVVGAPMMKNYPSKPFETTCRSATVNPECETDPSLCTTREDPCEPNEAECCEVGDRTSDCADHCNPFNPTTFIAGSCGCGLEGEADVLCGEDCDALPSGDANLPTQCRNPCQSLGFPDYVDGLVCREPLCETQSGEDRPIADCSQPEVCPLPREPPAVDPCTPACSQVPPDAPVNPCEPGNPCDTLNEGNENPAPCPPPPACEMTEGVADTCDPEPYPGKPTVDPCPLGLCDPCGTTQLCEPCELGCPSPCDVAPCDAPIPTCEDLFGDTPFILVCTGGDPCVEPLQDVPVVCQDAPDVPCAGNMSCLPTVGCEGALESVPVYCTQPDPEPGNSTQDPPASCDDPDSIDCPGQNHGPGCAVYPVVGMQCVPLQGWNSTGSGSGGGLPDPFAAQAAGHATRCPYHESWGQGFEEHKWAQIGMNPVAQRQTQTQYPVNYHGFSGEMNYTVWSRYDEQTCSYQDSYKQTLRMGWSLMGNDRTSGPIQELRAYMAFNGATMSGLYSMTTWTKPVLTHYKQHRDYTNHILVGGEPKDLGYENVPDCQQTATQDAWIGAAFGFFVGVGLNAVPGGWVVGLAKVAIGFAFDPLLDLAKRCDHYREPEPLVYQDEGVDLVELSPNPAQASSSEVGAVQWYTADFDYEADPFAGAKDGIIKMDSIVAWYCQGWYGGNTHRQVYDCDGKSFASVTYAEMEIRS